MKCQLEKIWILRNIFEIYNVCIIFSYLCRPRFLKESIRGMISYEDLKTIIFLGSSSIISSSWSSSSQLWEKENIKTSEPSSSSLQFKFTEAIRNESPDLSEEFWVVGSSQTQNILAAKQVLSECKPCLLRFY